MVLHSYNPFKFFAFLSIFWGFSGQGFAQKSPQEIVDWLYTTNNEVAMMYILEQFASIEHTSQYYKIPRKQEKKIDSIRNVFLDLLEKKHQTNSKKKLSVLVNSKLGAEYIKQKNNAVGFSYLKKAEKASPEQNVATLFYYYFNKHEAYGHLKRKDSTTYYAKKMAVIAPMLKNDSLNTEVMLILGSAYFRNTLYKDARSYFLKAIKQLKNNPKLKHRNITYLNSVATSYRNEKRYDSTLFYYKEALDLAEASKDTVWIAIVSGNLGYTYFLKNDHKKGIPYIEKELRLATRSLPKGKKLNNPTNIALIALADGYLYTGDITNTKMYIDSARNNIDPNNIHWGVTRDFFRVSAKIALQEGDYKQAFLFSEKYHAASDSVNAREMTKKAQEISAQFDFERQQIEIDKLYIENEKKEAQNKQQFYFIWGISAILGVISILAYFLYKSNRQRKHNNMLLASQKEEMVTQAEKLRETNQKLLNLDEFKQNMLGTIVHDLKNPLNALLNIFPTEIAQYNKQVRSYSNQMLNLVLNILDVQKFEDTQIKVNLAHIDFGLIIKEACGQIDFMCKEKNINIKLKHTANKLVILDYEAIVRVLVNLLTNAIKYSKQNTEIHISTYLEQDKFYCSVQDFGRGIPESMLQSVFGKFVQLDQSEDPKTPYRSTGLGLTYCKMMIEAHEGNIWAESVQGKGAVFTFSLPHLAEEILMPNAQNILINAANVLLSTQDQTVLIAHKKALAEIEVYYMSELETILQKIDFQSDTLKKWEAALRESIRNTNQARYAELIAMIA